MRIESGKLKDDVERVQRMCDELTGANAAGNAERAALIEANDAALTALKTENAALTEQLSASSAKTLKAKTKYKKAKADKDALQQMLNDSTNSPHAEEHMHFDSTAMPEDPGELDDYTPGNDPEEDNSDDDDGKTEVVVERQGAVSVEAAMDQYRKHFDALGRPSGYTLPAASELVVFDTAKAYAKAADTNSSSSNHSFLYMPGRTTQMRRGHYAVFGPTHRYDWAAGVWIDSDLDVLYGTTQELFVPAKKSKIKYMGSYECQDLRNLSPAGIICPDAIVSEPILLSSCMSNYRTDSVSKNTRAIEDVALGAPRPPNFEAIIQQRYPDGVIKVHAMGLRFIEFNYKLYDSLRRNKKGDRGCKSTPVIRKRKAEDEVVVGHRYGLRKRQKTEESPA
ncbi:hypothetical protein DFH06DRAFT_1166754 [Mycena polygramma]|nr:hypothetical protein DFH06DRAFT_1166754 [Mycena polygramma]